MTDVIDQISEHLGTAEKRGDLAAIQKLSRYFTAGNPAAYPFQPALALNAETLAADGIETGDMAQESSAVLPLANAISRAGRALAYKRKRVGYAGPIIVSEGDSWFQYPFILDDIIDIVMDRFAVRSLGAGGDLLDEMIQRDEFSEALDEEKADIFLFSGGGNDMLRDRRLVDFLVAYQEGMTAEEVIDQRAFGAFRGFLRESYHRLFDDLARRFPKLKILCHGYDYAIPRDAGTWLGGPLAERGVAERLWPEVVVLLIDAVNLEIKTVAAELPGRVFPIDCRGLVGSANSWHDELHPKDPGFARVARRFIEQIEALQRGEAHRPTARVFLPEGVEPAGPAVEAVIDGPPAKPPAPMFQPRSNAVPGTPMAPTHIPRHREAAALEHPCASLAAWRARLSDVDRDAYGDVIELKNEWDIPDTEARRQAREELLVGDDNSIERILGRSNLFQINFLEKGYRVSRAVGRISIFNEYQIPRGFGTGFLVAPGLLLTNSHVLDRRELARWSYVLFDYAYDAFDNLLRALRFDFSDEIFYTSKELDFTFISVRTDGRDGDRLEDIGHLQLIRESGKALKKEFVSIIQHGSGHPKQIAMRESQVIGRKRQYVYYTTDTNPGSSGSPVVNDDWLTVALHHRTVPDYKQPCRYVANRGIRISSIFENLDAAATAGDEMATKVLGSLEK